MVSKVMVNRDSKGELLIKKGESLFKKAWEFWQGALIELKKVVWPTRKETIQSTLSVLAMVFAMGIFLWSMDALLLRMVAWLMGHSGGVL